MKKKTLKAAFEKYFDLMFELSHLCFLYHSVFGEISRRNTCATILILHKEFSEAEKQELDDKLTLIEEDIKKATNSVAAHLDYMENLLKNETAAVAEQETYKIDKAHIVTMCQYRCCLQSLRAIQKFCDNPERMSVSLDILETKKKALHIAIKEYNDKNLQLMNYKLMDVLEAEEEAKNEMNKE